jgi:hypothetical protein
MEKWGDATPIVVKPRTRVCFGFDGSDNDDHTGIRLETLDGHQFTPLYSEKRRTYWRPEDWNGRIPRAEVNAAVSELANSFQIVRAYCDPFLWESEIDAWAALYGEKTFIKWPTNKIERMHFALERFRTDVYNPESDFTHDDHDAATAHLRNAIIRARTMDKLTGIRRYILGKASETQKIDLTMSSVLAHEARMDAIADGALAGDETNYAYY